MKLYNLELQKAAIELWNCKKDGFARTRGAGGATQQQETFPHPVQQKEVTQSLATNNTKGSGWAPSFQHLEARQHLHGGPVGKSADSEQ